MCGIAGFWGDGDQTDADRMTDTLAHRGPDGRGVWKHASAPLYLGHRRLSIIDLEGGRQPMTTPDGKLVITFNGEIYNHVELRGELEDLGHRFETDHSDTEVLLYAYREWGESMTERLNGMWAFAIFDHQRDELFLSRDRFGKKPLFYVASETLFAFASELNALTSHSHLNPSISELALQKFFAYGYIPAPHSLYNGIGKLPAGHSLKFSLRTGRTAIRKYWDYVVEPFESIPRNAEREWGEEIVRLLEASVKRRLMADVELGIFLSGGIDSSSVAALAARCAPGTVKTFSIGFEEKSFDESGYALAASRAIGSDHYCETLSMEKSRELLPEILGKLDEPMGDSSLLPTYLVSQIARKRVKVVLGGDGADELFAGYDPFHALAKADLYSKCVPRPVHKAISLFAGCLPVSHGNMSLDFKIKRTLSGLGFPPPLWCPVWMAPLPPSDLGELFDRKLDPEEIYSEAIQAWDDCPQDNLADKVMQFYLKLYLQDDILVKTDRASMMHGLEARAPFLDIDLVDFVRRIPWQYKYRRGKTKYILKKALAGVLPESILTRRKKGFGVPIGQWFHEEKLVLDPGANSNNISSSFIAECSRSHVAGDHDHRLFLWNAWMLEKMKLV